MHSAFEYVVENQESSLAVFHRQHLERNNRRKIAVNKHFKSQLLLSPPTPKLIKPISRRTLKDDVKRFHQRRLYDYPIGPVLPLGRAASDRELLRWVATAHGITPKEILGPRRLKKIIPARQEYMWSLVYYPKNNGNRRSLPEAGRRCGERDHTTILHGIRAYCAGSGMPAPKTMSMVRGKKGYNAMLERLEKERQTFTKLYNDGLSELVIIESMGIKKSAYHRRLFECRQRGYVNDRPYRRGRKHGYC